MHRCAEQCASHRGHVPGDPALVRTTVETGGGRRGSYAVQVWSAHGEGHSVPAAGDGRGVVMHLHRGDWSSYTIEKRKEAERKAKTRKRRK